MSLLSRLFRRPLPSVTSSPWIEARDLAERLNAPDAPLVLDVRGRDEFVGPLRHIPGALNLPLPELPARMAVATGTTGRGVVVVCKTDRRSAIAADQLRCAGAADVSVLRGGMETWRRSGLPTG